MISEIESENQLLRNIKNIIIEKDEDKKKIKKQINIKIIFLFISMNLIQIKLDFLILLY